MSLRIANVACAPGASVPIGSQLSLPKRSRPFSRAAKVGQYGNRNGRCETFVRRTRYDDVVAAVTAWGRESEASSGHLRSFRRCSGGARTPTLITAPWPRHVRIVKLDCASPIGREA